MLLLSCVEAPLAPVLPTSDVQLSVPLLNRTKYVYDFAAKDTSLHGQPDGTYIFQLTDPFKPISVDTFSLSLKAGTRRQEIGSFVIDPPLPLSVQFTFQQLTGLPPPPTPVPIPAGSLSVPGADFGPLADFEFVSFSSGTVSLHVTNNLPFPVLFTDPFVVRNNVPSDTNEVARFDLGGVLLSARRDTAVSLSLAGVLMRNSLRFPACTMSTPGTGGTAVPISGSDGILVEFAFSNISADSARAIIPAQSIVSFQDSAITISDSTALSWASFRRGSFDVILHNHVDVDVDASVSIKELISRSTGLSYTRSVRVNGLSSAAIAFDAKQFILQTSPAGLGTLLTFTINAAALASPNFRTLRSTDFLEAEMKPVEPMRIQKLTGRIQPTTFSISSGASGSELGDVATKFKGTVSFDSILVGISLMAPTGFPLDYDLRLVAMNRKTFPIQVDSLDIPPPIGSTMKRILPGSSNAVFVPLGSTSALNSFLSKFVPSLPDTFIVRGSATLNPTDVYATPAGYQTIYDTSHVYGSIRTEFPLSLAITGGELSDTVDLSDQEKFPKDFVNSARSGTMYFEVTNSLPFSFSFQALLIGPTAAGRDTLLRIPSSGFRMIAPPDMGSDGFVAGPTTTAFAVSLTADDMVKFNRADVLKYSLRVETPAAPKIVKVRSMDNVRVKASANLVYTVNKQ